MRDQIQLARIKRGAAIAAVVLLAARPVDLLTTGVASADREPRPTIVTVDEKPIVNVKAPDTTEGEIWAGAIAFGATVLGGFLYWLGDKRTELFRQRSQAKTAQQDAVLEFGQVVLDYAEALGKEVDAADPQLQAKARLETEKAAARVLGFRRVHRQKDLTNQASALVEQREQIRSIPTVLARGAFLENTFKPAISQFLNDLTDAAEKLGAGGSAPAQRQPAV